MMLLTKQNIKQLPALYSQDGLPETEKKVWVKFFNPCGRETWYILEFDGKDTMYCFITGSFEDEFGYTSLKELSAIRLPGGLGIERDRHFKPGTSLQEAIDNKL